MEFFCRDEWKAFRQIEAHLIAEDRAGAGAGPIGFIHACGVDVAHEGFVLVHKGDGF